MPRGRTGGKKIRINVICASAPGAALARHRHLYPADWVCCDACKQWRTVPEGWVAANLGEDDPWTCASHPVPLRADRGCEAPLSDEEVVWVDDDLSSAEAANTA